MYVYIGVLVCTEEKHPSHQLNYDSHGQITEALPSETTCFVLPHADPPVPIRGVPWDAEERQNGRPKKNCKIILLLWLTKEQVYSFLAQYTS